MKSNLQNKSRHILKKFGTLVELFVGVILRFSDFAIEFYSYVFDLLLMHIPNCYWYEIFTASLIAEDSDSNRLSWLEEAKDNAADISSLFISCPSYGTNYQMSHRDMRCIWIIFLQFFALNSKINMKLRKARTYFNLTTYCLTLSQSISFTKYACGFVGSTQ